jgi:hypothetical protein
MYATDDRDTIATFLEKQVHLNGFRSLETKLEASAMASSMPWSSLQPGAGRCTQPVVDGRRRPQCLRFHGIKGHAAAEFCFIQSFKGVIESGNSECLRQLRPQDVVLFNSGLHFQRRERAAYKLALEQFITSLGGLGKRKPLAVWRETSAQHFRGSAEFRRFEHVKLSYRCSDVAQAALRASNWRNQVAEAFVGRHMPILRVWNISAAASFAHTHVRVKTTHGNLRLADCTHFCNTPGGMYAIWTTLLFNQLQMLLARNRKAAGKARG